MNLGQRTVFVVDDDPQMRKSLCRLLDAAGLGNEAFASATEFLEAYDSTRPGCLLLDVRMPDMSGLECQTKLAESGIEIPVILISGTADVRTAVQAMERGAIDLLEKPFDDERLLERVELAFQRDEAARGRREGQSSLRARFSVLTSREQEVMQCLAAGKNTKQLARELGISSKTADVHRANILEKLGIDNVVQLTNLLHQLDP